MNRIVAGLLALFAGFASIAATANWAANIERTPVSHFIGDPDAPITLTEYISYTCPHCRDFTLQGEELLKISYIREGKVRLEIRHVAANPVDLTAAMMARCGAPEKFPGNHVALMAEQPQINALRRMATKSQTDRWEHGDPAARRRAVASDLGLYPVFERRGYSQVELNQCLADQDLAGRIEAAAQADYEDRGVRYTPSFAVNGELLAEVHDWQTLQTALGTAMSGAPTQK